MSKVFKYAGLCLLFLIFEGKLKAEDYRWIITYPTATNAWGRRIASGENKAVMKLQFIDLDGNNDYKMTQLRVRPFTSAASWYIESLELWFNNDNYPGSLDRNTDSLVASVAISIAVQSSPTNPVAFTLPGNVWLLNDTTTFFVAMTIQDWRTDDPEDLEVANQHGNTIGITVNKSDNDIIVITTTDDYSKTSNSWGGDITKLFQIQAVNLPVIIFNRNHSAEEDSNMFFPNYLTLDESDTSKAQLLTDLTFTAHVFLPHVNIVRGDSLSYASFKVGWNNQYLELDSIAFGDLWDDKQYQENGWDESGYGVTTLPGDTNYSVVRFEAIVIGNSSSPQNYVPIANNSLGEFYFKVLKPGVSPLFLIDILILDQWGIPYHCYRELQNDADATAAKYDAWSKQIPGDFCGTIDLNDGHCDALVDPFTDISLFADHLWLNPDSAEWYYRFDIGDSSSHDPDALAPDDTTNFFDLMVIAANYYRSLSGAFSQKQVSYPDDPVVEYDWRKADLNSNQYLLQLNMENIPQLVCAHLVFKFNPEEIEFSGIEAGDWVENRAPQSIWLYSAERLAKGYLDINFVALDRPLCDEGEFARIGFRQKTATQPEMGLSLVDLRDLNCRQIRVNTQPPVAVASAIFLLECYPNPFNPSTELRYRIPIRGDGNYRIAIFDLRGRQVVELVNQYHQVGNYQLTWSGLDQLGLPVASGVYIVRVSGPKINQNYKITLMR